MNYSSVLRIAAIAILVAVAIALDSFRATVDFASPKLAYDSSRQLPYEIRTPVDSPDMFRLQFDVVAKAAGYDNILQASGSDGPTLRLEVEPPHRLVMIPFGLDVAPVVLSNEFVLGRAHRFELFGTSPRHFSASVDGKTTRFDTASFHQVQSSAQVGTTDFVFRFDRIEIGAGFTPPRRLHGKITNLHFDAQYRRPVSVTLLASEALCLCAAAIWLLLPWLRRLTVPVAEIADASTLVIVAGCTFAAALAAEYGAVGGKWVILLAMGAAAILSVAVATRVGRRPLPRGLGAAFPLAVMLLSAASLFWLPNRIAGERMFDRWPVSSAVVATVFLCLSVLVVSNAGSTVVRSSRSRWFAWIPYALFATLAVRSDSLFAPINALHWEYFLGPIRALRQGGWLLWDVPAQYGYLNVLIPALLPIRPSVEAFYCFQAVVLFGASALFYRTLRLVLGVGGIAACAIVVAAFFLADPLLIGPSAYPSMGPVRFLWCYVLLGIAATNFLGRQPSLERFARYGTIAWTCGVLWSAESAIYSTVVFFAPFAAAVAVRLFGRSAAWRVLREPFRLLLYPVCSLVIVVAVIEIVYRIVLKHGPDWSMFIAYIRSYGGGFGELPVPIYGPLWVFAFALFAGAAVYPALLRDADEAKACAVAAAAATVWIVSSYYFGRAYPVVVTMLLPLVIFALFTILRAARGERNGYVQSAVVVPIFALLLFSSFWNLNAPAVAGQLATAMTPVWRRLPQVDPELEGLLAKLRVDPSTPVVYYDTWVAMPRARRGPYDNSWLPAPLQQLEDPITPQTRAEIVSRFVRRHRMSGYFVEVLDGSNTPASAHGWFTTLAPYYTITEVARSADYRILYCSIRDSKGSRRLNAR